MLDFSSGSVHSLLFLVDITLVRLLSISLSRFTFHNFHYLFFSLSQYLIISMKDYAVLALSCLSVCFVLSPFFFWRRQVHLSAVLHVFFLPSCSLLIFFLQSHTPHLFSQAKRSQAVCPDPSVPVNALAWRLWCDAVTSTFTHCPKASPET